MLISSDGLTSLTVNNSSLSAKQAGEKTPIGARTATIPTPVWVIGSYDKEGRPNMMTSSWVGICSSKPPALMTCLRKATYSHGNIMDKKAFTVNIASESLARFAAYVGRVSGRDTKKFKETGLTPVKSTLVDAPYIQEFPLVAECRVINIVEVGSHTMFIGEIMDIKADPSILGTRDYPDLEKLKPFVFSPGASRFYSIGPSLGTVSELAEKGDNK
jgi:flavin reductase (DIM6/NTAB) family NADH-FMN oxidoreductase RutF